QSAAFRQIGEGICQRLVVVGVIRRLLVAARPRTERRDAEPLHHVAMILGRGPFLRCRLRRKRQREDEQTGIRIHRLINPTLRSERSAAEVSARLAARFLRGSVASSRRSGDSTRIEALVEKSTSHIAGLNARTVSRLLAPLV